MKARSVLVLLAAIAVVGSLGVTAVGAGEVPASITLTLAPTTGPAGTDITAAGDCFETGGGECDSVILTLFDPDEVEVDSDIVDALPAYTATLTVPADGPCGTYTVLAEGEENETIEVDTSAVFEVPCPEPPTTEPPAESTTSSSQAVAAAGATRPTFTG